MSNLDLGTWDDIDYYTDIKVKSKHKVGVNPTMELTRNQLKKMIILFLKQHDWCHPLEPNADIDRFERVFMCAIGDTYIEMHLIVDLNQYDVFIG